MHLTEKQEAVLTTLRTYEKTHGTMPTLVELKTALEASGWEPIKSLNSVAQYITSLKKKGLISRVHKKRGIALLSGHKPLLISIPFLASPVACGTPTRTINEQRIGTIQVSRTLVPRPGDTYAFRATGDSMDKAGIQDGDTLLVEATTDIRDGDTVIATIDDYVTCKRLKRGISSLSLLPVSSNPIHSPIVLSESDAAVIAGKVIHVLPRA